MNDRKSIGIGPHAHDETLSAMTNEAVSIIQPIALQLARIFGPAAVLNALMTCYAKLSLPFQGTGQTQNCLRSVAASIPEMAAHLIQCGVSVPASPVMSASDEKGYSWLDVEVNYIIAEQVHQLRTAQDSGGLSAELAARIKQAFDSPDQLVMVLGVCRHPGVLSIDIAASQLLLELCAALPGSILGQTPQETVRRYDA